MSIWWMLLPFAVIVVIFHAGELLFIRARHRATLSFESALLSGRYLAMMAFTLAEFAAESVWLPAVKWWPASVLGITLCAGGEAVRKTAMVTAGRAFTHRLATGRRAGHVLVTGGIYRLSRHPGYLGWLCWAVGAQMVLSNPVATLLAAVVGWRFLHARIAVEEAALRAWFGPAYDDYRRRTPTLIPFIA